MASAAEDVVERIQPKPRSLYPLVRPGKESDRLRPTQSKRVSQTASAAVQTQLVLGRYRPLRPLGSGGSGSVWLARDEQTGLDVALKIVPREGKAGARAEREAEAASRLRHPSCQRAYGFGRDSQHVYIAYEYTPGRTFREALRAGELDDAAAIEAAAKMLEGLAHAHARGIVHRDVKPSNVLLAEHDRSVRLLDFGLARLPQAETLTAAGDVPGTLAYIAPERLGGEAATAAADVWAVGVLLWEALAGRHPFWQASLLETARAIGEGAPPLASLRPDLPRPLLAAVDRALDLDPARRPPAGVLAQTLREAGRRRRARGPRGTTLAIPAPIGKLGPALLAAAFAGWTAWSIPFYPGGWPIGLAVLSAALSYVRPRLGLVVALAVPVLPFGNLALAAALLYAIVAAALLALAWREPQSGLLVVAGPLLALTSALGLLPLIVLRMRSAVRRAANVAAAVLAAGVVAGIRGAPLPFDGETPPHDLGIAGSRSLADTGSVLWHAVASRPALAIETIVLAVAAVLLPFARARGPWYVAAFGAAMLPALLLPVPDVAAIPLVVCVWAICAAVVVR
jgi:serine/threonine-protein kinase